MTNRETTDDDSWQLCLQAVTAHKKGKFISLFQKAVGVVFPPIGREGDCLVSAPRLTGWAVSRLFLEWAQSLPRWFYSLESRLLWVCERWAFDGDSVGHVLQGFFFFLVLFVVIRLPMQETQETRVWFLVQEDPLEDEMAPHSSILAWKIPWTKEPGGLQSTELQNQTRPRDWTWTHPSIVIDHWA